MNIITIQHTESEHHLNDMVGSRTDWLLTSKGEEDIKTISNNLKKFLQNKDIIIFTSPLKRAKNGAILLAEIIKTKKIVIDNRLNQLDLGDAVGKTLKWLKENNQSQEITLYSRAFLNSENNSEVWDRVASFYKEVTNEKYRNKTIIIISHGIILSILNSIHLGLNKESTDDFIIKGESGGVSFYGFFPNGKRYIHKISDMSYMKKE